MAQLDALKLTEALRQRMVDFAVDDNFVRDRELGNIARSIWSGPGSQGGLISDLWVEGAFPSKASSFTLDSLVSDGAFHPGLRDVLHQASAVPRDRPLYTHQHEAIVRAQSGKTGQQPAIVVTAGTGAGKTESFLLPILNDLYQNPSAERRGARCIILYPMNALVNDQVERLYSWLKGQTQVTLFHFTSETPEDRQAADNQDTPVWDPCRMRTRQQARGLESRNGTPNDASNRGPTPDIVITNYSMLEYMLCRPRDSVFFGPDLRAIVLDEAHLYTGTLAAEITLLLRRLLLRCGLKSENVLQFATSATLGTGDTDELKNFGSQVFSKPVKLVHVVAGEPARTALRTPLPPERDATAESINARNWLNGPAIIENNGEPELATSDSCEELKEDLTTLVSDAILQKLEPDETRPAVLLYESLSAAPIIHQLEEILWERKHVPLKEITESIFGEESEQTLQATVRLLQLSASARRGAKEYPLVPHRIHVVVRPTDCLTVCLNAGCSGSTTKLPPMGAVAAGYQDTCGSCFSRTLSLERCRNCGEWLLTGQENEAVIVASPPRVRPQETDGDEMEEGGSAAARRRLFRPATNSSLTSGTPVYIDPASGVMSYKDFSGAARMISHTECPNCHARSSQMVSFYSGAPITLSILAETLLAEMPEFSAQGSWSEWLPARGRRLLAFSDSRREAARLGPMLTNQHEQQLVRAAIVRATQEIAISDDASLRRARRDLQRITDELNIPDLTPGERLLVEEDLSRARSRLTDLEAGGSMKSWVRSIQKIPNLSQAMDRPTSVDHIASEWSQDNWEANGREVRRRVHELLGRELARPNRGSSITLEPLGLIEVTYPGLKQLEPPPAFVGCLPTEAARRSVTGQWTDLLAAICDTLRMDGAVTLGDEADRNYLFGRALVGRWATADDSRGETGRLVRFIGATRRQRRRRFTEAVLNACGIAEDAISDWSERLLRAAFNQLLSAAKDEQRFGWLEFDRRQINGSGATDAIRIKFSELGLCRPATLFQCQTTGHVWPRSVIGCAPEVGCERTLEPISHNELDTDPRLGRRRTEYSESPIFEMGLWAEEHSAQLDPKENRRLQDLFKAGIRNILSSTTTLELGIDIGGLNGVLMSNVPPGKANYLQRAGRAGRRADGSSVVTTFARPRPFDREVFQRIGDYLGMPLRRSVVLLDRERVVRRHLHAFLLGAFFGTVYSPDQRTGAMDAYGRMGSFCQVPRSRRWDRGERTRPEIISLNNPPSLRVQFASFLAEVKLAPASDVAEQVDALLAKTAIASGSTAWDELINDAAIAFDEACDDWQNDYQKLLDLWKEAGNPAQSNALHYQLRLRHETTVIEALSDRQFLPRYGFPIGVLKLRVMRLDEDYSGQTRIREEDQFRLERQGLLALREYVPGSQVLVGGQLVTSHGVLKHWTGENIDAAIGIRGQYTKCVNGHFYYWPSADGERICPFCGEIAGQTPTSYIVPQYGFSGATWDPAKWSATTPEIVGEVETVPASFTFTAGEYPPDDSIGGISGLSAHYREDGELLVYNEGSQKLGFAICLRCGYSDSEHKFGKGAVDLPPGFANHSPLNSQPRQGRWWPCWRSGTVPPVLRNQTLAARETTDVLLLDFSGCLDTKQQNDQTLITTLAYALHRAAAELLQLDGRELGVDTMPAGELGRGLGVLLYDNVPGGAGHVRELLEIAREWLEHTKDVMFIDEAHNQRCQSACLDCLLSFQAQNAMLRGHLNRPYALSLLSDLLEG